MGEEYVEIETKFNNSRAKAVVETDPNPNYILLNILHNSKATCMAPPRKPPPLNLTRPIPSNTVLEFGSPILDFPDSPLQLSSPDSPLLTEPDLLVDDSTTSSSSDATSDDISKDLAVLEKLRKSVQKNLRLRPIKSSSSLPKLTPQYPQQSVISPSPWRDLVSPVSSAGSVYYTPIDNVFSPPFSARFVGRSDSDPSPATQPQPQSRALDPALLYDLLSSPNRPLLIDTRPPASYIAAHIRHSINIAIPSLILKRYRKPGSSGFQSLDALRQFITSEDGKQSWDDLVQPGRNSSWNGSVVVYDEEMNEKDRENPQMTAWAIIPLIVPLLLNGTVDYLKHGFSAACTYPRLRMHVVSDEQSDGNQQREDLLPPPSARTGLFQIDTQAAARSKVLPELDRPPTAHSPMPVMPAAMSSSDHIAFDSTPSPPPSQLAFRRPPPPRKPSAPNLRRLDTRSAERLNTTLPKLHIRTPPMRAATLAAPTLQIPTTTTASSLQPHSPSHLNLRYSNHTPPGSVTRYLGPPIPSPNGVQAEFLSPHPSRPTTPRTPSTPMPISSPSTARPDLDAPPTTEEAFPAFTISAILPNFLYLGPELTTSEHVEELKMLGVKRIINIAAECDDDNGLNLRENFERYFHIPMRDIVEEENITRGVREACDIIGPLSPFPNTPNSNKSIIPR